MYRCASCNRTFEKLTEVRCPHCRGRILVKTRSEIARKIKVK